MCVFVNGCPELFLFNKNKPLLMNLSLDQFLETLG